MSNSLAVIAVAFGLLGSFSCVEINGGAVELAWLLRDFEGDANSCEKARVTKIRICWQSVPGPFGSDAATGDGTDDAGAHDTIEIECVSIRTDGGFRRQFRVFDCLANRGVTRFEVPLGWNALFVEPLCGEGIPAGGPYQVPPPIIRYLGNGGDVVTLNQLLIVVSNDRCEGEECTCPQ